MLTSVTRVVDISQSSTIAPIDRSGDLKDISLRKSLRQLQLQQKTGTFTLLSGSLVGHITMLGGLIHSAEFGILHDKAAIESMVTIKEGHFIFRLETPQKDTGLDLSVSDVFKEIDELPFENTGALLPGSSGHDIKS